MFTDSATCSYQVATDTHSFTQPTGCDGCISLGLLSLLRQRQRDELEQQRLERQLLEFIAQLADERQEPELQLRRSQSPEQQQSLQRLCGQGSAALIEFLERLRYCGQVHSSFQNHLNNG